VTEKHRASAPSIGPERSPYPPGPQTASFREELKGWTGQTAVEKQGGGKDVLKVVPGCEERKILMANLGPKIQNWEQRGALNSARDDATAIGPPSKGATN